MNQPFYKIKFSSTSCNFELRINDIPIFSYVDTGMIATEYPINQLLLTSGEQKVSLRLWPQGDQQSLTEHSKLNISIVCNDVLNPTIVPQEVYAFITPVLKNNVPLFEFTGSFKADIPYQLEGWTNSTSLNFDDNLTKELFGFYEKVHRILEKKDFNEYRDIYKTKLVELDTALYSTPNETNDEWQELVEYLENPNMQIAPIPKEYKVILYGDKKVVSIQQVNLEPLLYFENIEERTQYQVSLLLHKPNESNTWEAIR